MISARVGGVSSALLLVASVAPVHAQSAGTWTVDHNHSQVGFTVRHFFTPVRGEFTEYVIEMDYDPENPSGGSVNATMTVASVETGNQRRNNHLQTTDFFDAESFPEITFTSSSVRGISESELVAVGTLTIRDVSREVELPISILGVREFPEEQQQRSGKRVASFQATLEIDRLDFGVGSGSWAETTVVGPKVEIEILVEARQR